MKRIAAILMPFAFAQAALAAEDTVTLADFARTGDLICELRKSGNPPKPQRSKTDLLLVVDEVGSKSGAARVVSSNKSGARAVKIYAGDTGVHLVEDVLQSVVVTTLLGCEARANPGARCRRYGAVIAWHFDRSVHHDPDKAFRRLPGTSYAGFCEPWHMDEAVTVGR